jgi:hypothetical protein
MTKPMVRVTRTKGEKRASIGLSFRFDTDDPQAEKIYRGIGLCLKEALTPEEAEQFMREFEAARKKLAGGSE